MTNKATNAPTAAGGQGGFFKVFLVRSFHESHLERVAGEIRKAVREYTSNRWGNSALKPYELFETSRDITDGRHLGAEIFGMIAEAAITIVILDGLRANVAFELGCIHTLGKPVIVLKHKRWGPSIFELDEAFSDFKGLFLREYDDEEEAFAKLLAEQLDRVDKEFVESFGTHSVGTLANCNLIRDTSWNTEENGTRIPATKMEDGIHLKSFLHCEVSVNHFVKIDSLFLLRFRLDNPRSQLTVYLEVVYPNGKKPERSIFLGYSTEIVQAAHDYRPGNPVEMLVPLQASGPGEFFLSDNVEKMVANRLRISSPTNSLVRKIRLRGPKNGDALTVVSEVMLAGG